MTHMPQQTQRFPRTEIDLSGPRNAEYFQVTFWKIQKCSFKEQTSKISQILQISSYSFPRTDFLTCLAYKAMYSSCGRDFECQVGNLFHKAYWFLQTNLLKYLSLYKSYWLWDCLPLGYSLMQSKNPSPI